MKKCDYCNIKEAKHFFPTVNKWCCEKNWQSCELSRETFSKCSKGRKHSESTKEYLRKINLGENNPFYGKTGWLKGKTKGTYKKLEEMSKKISKVKSGVPNYKLKYKISSIKEMYPIFSKEEEIRYNPDKPEEKEIQVHCKNHKCLNSKEQGGWFSPKSWQISARIRAIEKAEGFGGSYFYCCEECKYECPLYDKKVTQLIKEDQIKAGIIKETYYTTEEYQVFREEVLNRSDNKCEYCEEEATDVHHIRPQKLEPFFSLDPDFGIACCKKCHYEKGHKDECSTGQLASKICI